MFLKTYTCVFTNSIGHTLPLLKKLVGHAPDYRFCIDAANLTFGWTKPTDFESCLCDRGWAHNLK